MSGQNVRSRVHEKGNTRSNKFNVWIIPFYSSTSLTSIFILSPFSLLLSPSSIIISVLFLNAFTSLVLKKCCMHNHQLDNPDKQKRGQQCKCQYQCQYHLWHGEECWICRNKYQTNAVTPPVLRRGAIWCGR